MKQITNPIRRGERNENVGNLQDVLLLLIDKGIIEFSADEQHAIIESLSGERQHQRYENSTVQVVGAFQTQHRNVRVEELGDIVNPTAEALNRELRELGLLDTESPPDVLIVRGRVVDSSGAPVPNVSVTVFDRDLGAARDELGSMNVDESGRFVVRYR